jgi:hypothetical protein
VTSKVEATTHSEPLSTAREVELLRDLRSLASDCRQSKARIRAALKEGLARAKKTWQSAVEANNQKIRDARIAASAEHEQITSDIHKKYEQDRDSAQQKYKGLRHNVEIEHTRITETAKQIHNKQSWEAHALYDARRGAPHERFLETDNAIKRSNEELLVLEHDAAEIMKMRRQWREFPPPEATDAAPDQGGNNRVQRVMLGRPGGGEAAGNHASSADNVEAALARVAEMNTLVRKSTQALHDQRLTLLYQGEYIFGLFVGVWVLAALVTGFSLGWQSWHWVAASIAAALVGTAAILAIVWPQARRQSGKQYQEVQQLAAQTRQAMQAAVEAAQERGRREAQDLLTERDRLLATLEQKLRVTVSDKDKWKETELTQAGERFPAQLAQLREDMQQNLAAAAKKFNDTLAELTADHDRKVEENRRRYDDECRELQAQHDEDWQDLTQRWQEGLATFEQSVADLTAQCARLFPDWETTDYEPWPRPEAPTPAIQFGHTTFGLALAEDGLPGDGGSSVETSFDLPALLALDENPVMALTAEEEGRKAAADLMQHVMLRILTAMPPGKVRFTILDPVGLGENFASYMHLADYDELLIASRIWTEAKQIEEQLTRLTAHMETVLQKYLRNEFATIHEYNEQAGEVAEPFQVLVVANFPTNFGDTAARKLVSIITSGPRCGVYTLVSVDRQLRMPSDFALADLLSTAVHLDWEAEAKRFRWRHEVFEQLPLSTDPLPSAERLNEVIRSAGRIAKASMKVEVPFTLVAPSPEDIWSATTAKEMIVPIGRAGAMRLQSVRLGRGTSQHLLVCGKTGSGKSTFLHALITNGALHYSPDEVEFYLIDFKKGVEFKTYATHRLPHARVIAIESEREFGLSVLERLDVELRRRGDLFRAAGVQDLADFRAARPNEKMPRVLLVIDEFQELFVEDDKLSQEAALLLDRLVRQGRAFGMHVLLGSQTLSGAYSLARSTMGQMAVRVALQCSETDASMILSDERNTAARFLSRPGEAIYNDQNGLLAGNHPFQVVWLSESERIGYLKQIEAKSKTSTVAGNVAIVFEGDQPADPADNQQLRAALTAAPKAGLQTGQIAWLGAAVAIKDPTSATFGRHAGSNMLVVGAWDESALGVLTNAVIALAVQNSVPPPDAGPLFYVLDGTRPESPEAGAWQRLADALPHKIVVGGLRDTPRIINEIAQELSRREEEQREDAPPIYLVIFNGGRFRDLRRGEDDYSFSFDKDKPPAADKQFANMLRNGPAWGIHTLLWCDSYNNVTRMLDRMLLREFELRVAFQMSAADSASLLDNPAASRLRQHRGLLASEDLGTLEKFRPYGPPTEEWLNQIRSSLNALSKHA